MARIRALIGLTGLIAAGLLSAQMPAFVQQYLQRLGGHLDEARLFASQLADETALPDLPAESRQMVAISTDRRVARLARAHDAIAGAPELARPLIFVAYVDGDIATAAIERFQPGLPITLGGALYGGAGALLLFACYAGGRRLVRRRKPGAADAQP